ncbi:Short C-terminal domain-containing protein [Pedococcus dokdonensis]|uniref:Short C-terminal domain-containing protein n=1 Tax=Pedococcus dokdonensis TaxID=443156 RepID=A0A1H0UEJ1_9MICO|nr:SHOCT domain-containing protein [Pedococcus dokdonensis]SDP64543.1 Short C-terminal domain-containing protein [Pedococcus dokdonensis]
MTTLIANATTAASLVAHPDHYYGPGPWWPIFPFLWLLLIVGLFASFRFFGIRRWRQVQGFAGTRAGEAKLAERYAAGEIDEQEYERRLSTLKRMGSS